MPLRKQSEPLRGVEQGNSRAGQYVKDGEKDRSGAAIREQEGRPKPGEWPPGCQAMGRLPPRGGDSGGKEISGLVSLLPVSRSGRFFDVVDRLSHHLHAVLPGKELPDGFPQHFMVVFQYYSDGRDSVTPSPRQQRQYRARHSCPGTLISAARVIVPRVHEVVVVVGVVTFQTGPFRRKAPDRLAGRTLDMAASRAVTDLALHVPQAAVRLENREPAVAVQPPPRGISRTWKTGGDASSKVEVAQRAVGDAGGNRAIFPGGRLHFPATLLSVPAIALGGKQESAFRVQPKGASSLFAAEGAMRPGHSPGASGSGCSREMKQRLSPSGDQTGCRS